MARDDFAALYRAARNGEAAARDTLFRRYEAELLDFVRLRMGRHVRRKQEPADICQAVMVSVLGSLDRYPDEIDESGFRARLFQTAKWRIADGLARYPREVGESAAPAFDPPGDAPSTGPVTRRDELDRLRRVIAELRPTYASVLTACVLEGRSPAEAAEDLGLTEETVRKRLLRARDHLRERLGAPPADDGAR